MALRIPLYPFDLSRNPAYLFFLSCFEHSIYSWSPKFLHDNFGRASIEALVKLEIVTLEQDFQTLRDNYVLGFNDNGTTPNLILQRIKEEQLLSFDELVQSMTLSTRILWQLKHYLVYLSNFSQIEIFTMACSGSTLMIHKTDESVFELDELMSLTDRMEPEQIFSVDFGECSPEFLASQEIYYQYDLHTKVVNAQKLFHDSRYLASDSLKTLK